MHSMVMMQKLAAQFEQQARGYQQELHPIDELAC